MIPKIIHYCWLSGDPFPAEIQKCIDSWKFFLPDYELVLWDSNRFDLDSVLWTKQAYDNKKYAFAADYIRLYALYNYGGIYLDSDVIVYKSFNDLLSLPYFIGQDYMGFFEAAIIGAEKGQTWIKQVMNYYRNRTFIDEKGEFDMLPLPQIFLKQLYGLYDFKPFEGNSYSGGDGVIYLFNKDYFNSRNSIKARQTRVSYCAHNYAGSWKLNRNDLKSKVKNLIPEWVLMCYYCFTHNTFKKRWIHRADPIYLQSHGVKKLSSFNFK